MPLNIISNCNYAVVPATELQLQCFEGTNTCKNCVVTQLLFYAQQLVVFSHALAAAATTRFYMSCACSYYKVGNCGIFSFATAVRYETTIMMLLCHCNRLQCFCYC